MSLLLLLAACSSASSRQAAQPVSAPQPVPVVDDGRCLMGTPPTGDEPRADIDVDGDGAPEVVRMMRDGPCDDLASWRLSVDSAKRDLSESFGYVGPTPPYLLGGIDLDGDGDQEIWAHTGWDSMSARFALFSLRSGVLDYVRFENGRPAEWSINDGPKYQQGVACQSGDAGASTVAWYAADSNTPAGDPRLVSVRTYHLDGSVLRLDNQVSVPNDAASAAYWQLRCGPLTTMRPA